MKLRLKHGRNGIETTESVIVIVVMIVIAAVAFYIGSSQVQPAITNSVTATSTVTTMPSPPTSITVSGTLSTTGTGASPTALNFVSVTTGVSYPATISGSTYTISVPNTDTYNINIHWKTLVDSGTCSAGTIPLFIGYAEASSVTANWSC